MTLVHMLLHLYLVFITKYHDIMIKYELKWEIAILLRVLKNFSLFGGEGEGAWSLLAP